MARPPRRWAAELLHFWFGRLRPRDWWGGDAALDALISRRFLREHEMLAYRPAASFLTDPRTALAAVLLFDQVPRNVFRGDARAYTTDPLARAICRGALDRGFDRRLPRAQRQFLAMPLMHSEDIADQRRSLVVFRELGRGFGLPFARSHYRMIARFGRFPHRNAVLARRSSAGERAAIAAGFAW